MRGPGTSVAPNIAAPQPGPDRLPARSLLTEAEEIWRALQPDLGGSTSTPRRSLAGAGLIVPDAAQAPNGAVICTRGFAYFAPSDLARVVVLVRHQSVSP